jgi:hypothetical protein
MKQRAVGGGGGNNGRQGVMQRVRKDKKQKFYASFMVAFLASDRNTSEGTVQQKN